MLDPVAPDSPAPRNGAAVAGLVLGIVASAGGLLIGIRFSSLDLIFLGGTGMSIGGIVLGGVAPGMLFLGRFLGENHLGFPYPG